MAPLNWIHHTLIQALLSRGPLVEKEFHVIFSGVSELNPGVHNKLFDDVLLKINKELAYVKLELRGCRDQNDGKVYYGVVNTVADEQSKLGTSYSIPQIAFYRAILDAITQDASAHGSISSIDALNIRLDNQTSQASHDGETHVPAAFKSFTLAQKERTLHELVQDRWLSSSSDGSIGIGVRSFLDLRGWFRSNDVPSCDVCNEAAIKAQVCSGEGCHVRIHNYCLRNASQKAATACPNCGTPWNFSAVDSVNEKADQNPPGQSQEREVTEAASQRATRRLRSCKVEAAPEARSTRRSRRA